MKLPKVVLITAALAITALLLSGCSAGRSHSGDVRKEMKNRYTVSQKNGKITVAFSIASLQEERWQIDRDIFAAKCKELGADVIIQSANGDERLQATQCEKMLSQGIDVLVIIPQNCDTASAVVDAANKMKVPVVAYDRLIRNCTLDAFVTYDNVKIGEMQAEYLVKTVPKGNYIILEGAQTDYNSTLIKEGHMKVLKPFIDRGDIKVVRQQWTRDWNPSDARQIVEDSLVECSSDVQAVIAPNDGTAGGAIQALAEQRLAGKVAVSGQDADLAGCQRIVEGTQSMTVYTPIKAEAEANAEAAIKLARGERFEGNNVFDNARIMVPTLLLTPISVDKDNIVETVIKDGYQKLDEVFKNVPKSKWPPQR